MRHGSCTALCSSMCKAAWLGCVDPLRWGLHELPPPRHRDTKAYSALCALSCRGSCRVPRGRGSVPSISNTASRTAECITLFAAMWPYSNCESYGTSRWISAFVSSLATCARTRVTLGRPRSRHAHRHPFVQPLRLSKPAAREPCDGARTDAICGAVSCTESSATFAAAAPAACVVRALPAARAP